MDMKPANILHLPWESKETKKGGLEVDWDNNKDLTVVIKTRKIAT